MSTITEVPTVTANEFLAWLESQQEAGRETVGDPWISTDCPLYHFLTEERGLKGVAVSLNDFGYLQPGTSLRLDGCFEPWAEHFQNRAMETVRTGMQIATTKAIAVMRGVMEGYPLA